MFAQTSLTMFNQGCLQSERQCVPYSRPFWKSILVIITKHNITEEQLVAYVVVNTYVSIGNRVYRQCVGIPMGTDCAPLVANLFLLYYEYQYVRGLIKEIQ